MQVATAREGVLGHLGVGPDLLATVRGWTRTMLMRHGRADRGLDPAARARSPPPSASSTTAGRPRSGCPAGCVWLELSLLRGVLQGVGDYKRVGISLVGEQGARLVIAVRCSPRPGSGSPAPTWARRCRSWSCRRTAPPAAATHRPPTSSSPRRCPRAPSRIDLVDHVKRAWAPIAGLIVIAMLQNIDIIAAKHQFSKDPPARTRHGGGRQGADLGRDRGRLLPRARGLASACGRRGHAPRADASHWRSSACARFPCC